MRPEREEGAALLTVLLLVAVMSALAVAVLDDIRFGLRRTANAQAVGQAQWYAIGAESLARARLARLVQADPQRTSLMGDWNGRVLTFPIDDGVIRARVSDGGACFNLNSLVEGVPEQWSRRPTGVAQFIALGRALGLADAEALSEALADWIDSDSERSTTGAEDDAYTEGARSYRTGGTLLAETSELRAIRGFTPVVYARLRPYVCALPTAALSPINVNTLAPEKAVLLTAVTDGGLAPEAARQVIAARPTAGWADIDAFWTLPAMAAQTPSNEILGQLSVRTRFFDLRAEVDYAGANVVMSSLIEQPMGGPSRLVARRWTPDE